MLKYTGMNDHMFKKIFYNKDIFCYYANLFGNLNLTSDNINIAINEINNTIEGKTSIADVVFISPNGYVNFEAQNKHYSRIIDDNGVVIDDDLMDNRMITQVVSMGLDLLSKKDKSNINKSALSIWFLNYPLPNNKVYDELCFTNSITGKKYRKYDILKISLKNMDKDATITSEMKDALRILDTYDLEYINVGENKILQEVATMLTKLNQDEKELLAASIAAANESIQNQILEESRKKDEVITQQYETIAQKDETIALKDETIAQKNETIAQKDVTIIEQDKLLINNIKALFTAGVSIEQIAEINNKSIEDIKYILNI